jgi:metallo-beta-lactamase class B
MTGAQLVASAEEAKVLSSGTPSKDDPQFGVLKSFAPARVDKIVQDGEMIRLGNTVVKALATPGHTAGAISWHWGSCQGGVCRQIVYADSLSPVSSPSYRFSDHPAWVAAFRASIAKVAALPCDILVTPHPSASHMIQRFALGEELNDPNACRDYAAGLTKALDERLAKEPAGK